MAITAHHTLAHSGQAGHNLPLALFPHVFYRSRPQPLNILHVNASDIDGGAARAAYRIHRSLVEHGVPPGLNSQMRVISQLSDDPTVIGGPPTGQSPIWRRLQPRFAQQARRGFRTGNPTLHS